MFAPGRSRLGPGQSLGHSASSPSPACHGTCASVYSASAPTQEQSECRSCQVPCTVTRQGIPRGVGLRCANPTYEWQCFRADQNQDGRATVGSGAMHRNPTGIPRGVGLRCANPTYEWLIIRAPAGVDRIRDPAPRRLGCHRRLLWSRSALQARMKPKPGEWRASRCHIRGLAGTKFTCRSGSHPRPLHRGGCAAASGCSGVAAPCRRELALHKS